MNDHIAKLESLIAENQAIKGKDRSGQLDIALGGLRTALDYTRAHFSRTGTEPILKASENN
jgi:hypothetical protein